MPRLEREKAQQLLDQGLIDQAAYDTAFAETVTAGEPVDNFRTDEELEPVKKGRDMLQRQREAAAKASIKKADREQSEANTEEQQALLDDEKRRELARQFGYDEEKIAQNIPQAQPADIQTADLNGQVTPQLATDIVQEQPYDFERDGFQDPSIETPGYDLIRDGINAGMQAGAAKAAEESAYYQNMNSKMAREGQALERMREDQSQQIQAKEEELDSEINRVGSLAVDQNRYWANKSTGQKIASGIAMVLGAFGAGSQNRAVKVINDAIKQDINLQAQDIAKQKGLLSSKRGILQDMRARFRNDVMAKEAANQAYLQQAKLKIEEISSRYSGQQAKANALQLLGKIEMQEQASRQKFMQEYIKRLPVNPNMNPEMLDEDRRVRFVPGYGLAAHREEADKAKIAIADARSTNDTIKELLAINEKGGKSFDINERARAETLAAFLKGQLRPVIVGPGAVTDREQKLLDDIIADPTAILSLDSSNKTRLKTLMNKVENQLDNKMKAYNLTKPSDRIGFKPVGN